MEIANNVENRQTVFAMDALRNLFVQANLVEKSKFANRILEMGLLALLEKIIATSFNLIQDEKSKPNQDQKRIETLHLAIE